MVKKKTSEAPFSILIIMGIILIACSSFLFKYYSQASFRFLGLNIRLYSLAIFISILGLIYFIVGGLIWLILLVQKKQ